jgi:putative tryptophan/tyrosine transport system substrate-binding protein
MKRREFISLLGGAAAWPLAARAQQPRLPTIGYLGVGTPSSHSQWLAAFSQRLRELGWIEGRTIALETRWAEGHSARFAEIIAEFVQMKVDVIVAPGATLLAAKQAASTIPIVFPVAADPVGSGLVASLAQPGGNVTGLSLQQADAAGKRLEILRELLPDFRRLAVMANAGSSGAAIDAAEAEAAARRLRLETVALDIRRAEDIVPAFETLKGRADALYVVGDPLTVTNRMRINILALAARLPIASVSREFVEAGSLMSYGPSLPDLFRRAADYVDKILRGAKPSNLPVEQPTKFDLVINMITAKALGLDVPPTLLARADEVIE